MLKMFGEAIAMNCYLIEYKCNQYFNHQSLIRLDPLIKPDPTQISPVKPLQTYADFHEFCLLFTPWTQDANWMYIRRSEDVLNVFLTSYVRSICVFCSGATCITFIQSHFKNSHSKKIWRTSTNFVMVCWNDRLGS